MNIPNYPMLRLLLIESRMVKHKYPNAEQMPKGNICPGYDIELMEPLAALRYLCGVKTQWSCQGTHKGLKTRALYILLSPGERFPEDFEKLITEAGFKIEEVDDFDEKIGYTNKTRMMLSSSWRRNIKPTRLKFLNERLIQLLITWSRSKIKEHIANSEELKDPYYRDIVSLYSEAALAEAS